MAVIVIVNVIVNIVKSEDCHLPFETRIFVNPYRDILNNYILKFK